MSWLFPDERMFFRHFSEIAARLTTLATLLENALDDPTLVRAVRDIEAAVSHIRTGDEVLARCQAIKQAEEEGDAVWAAAVTDLFAGTPDPVDVIRWKGLYDQLEDTLDACDDVANELETITVNHS